MSEGSTRNANAVGHTDGTPAAAAPDTSGRWSRVLKWLKSDRRRDWFIGAATGLISGIIVAFCLSATGQAALTISHHTKPSCGNPQWLLQVPDNQVFAWAYNIHHDKIPNYSIPHVASDTIDGDLNTSWLQLWPSPSTYDGSGDSDYIQWSFAQPYDVRLICIVDGWSADIVTYTDTLPIGTATVYVTKETLPPRIGSPTPSNTCTSQHASFLDYLQKDGSVTATYQWQPVPFHCVTSNVVLRIGSVSQTSIALRAKNPLYSSLGSDRVPLTGLSEIRFYYCPVALCWWPTN